ncbi:MAG TPA: AlpA family phage regulatory protein [Alphaproteobacteria bacterium]|nr:AlpA family phage regulatory protein [Alphaproteobacteria bacterium]
MRILRVKAVAERIGYAVPSVWRKAKDEADFPKPVRIGPKCTGWIESEVDDYVARKVAESRGEKAAA